MLTVTNLTKTYSSTTAVHDLSFTVPDGQVTGFLGPNGSGKSTTMRMCLGLERPSEGSALFDGADFRSLHRPAEVVGSLLDAAGFHPGRSARAHLAYLAAIAGIPATRIDAVLDQVGLTDVARRKVGGFSLGMKQRLGLACALLGDPQHLLLDEPVNGLDPEGVHWMRDMIRAFAAQGRSVLVSSHLLSEMSLTADRLVVIGRGRLIGEGTVADFIGGTGSPVVEVRVDRPEVLAAHLATRGVGTREVEGVLQVLECSTAEIGEICRDLDLRVLGLGEKIPSLEEAFLAATADVVDYRAS
ncbi:ABC transporter ATP-binding protein [Corynebacterium sp. A21]|uniref:ABC transporter ATP-binding protein n=1 Tax=Corynebacterium sp. A21 TaxID=3457318 RepID=UPI003FD25DC7